MQYIPLADFFGFLGRTAQPVAAGDKAAVAAELGQLYASGKSISVAGKSISLAEAQSFLNMLSHPGIVVFDQWITHFSGVRNLLINGTLARNNFDPKIILEHRLFPDFSRFISVFLLPQMMRQLEQTDESILLDTAGYLNLLDSDSRLIVQGKLDAWLKSKLATTLADARKARTEQALARTINFIASDQAIDFVNQFDKAFYATKIAYIDQMLEIMKVPASTQRLGGWIAGQLKKLALNPEHVEKIKQIKGTVQSGNIRFLNENNKVSVGFSSVRTLSIIAGVIILAVFYLLWFEPFKSTVPEQVSESKSSFEQFTKEERMQMDSLIKSMDKLPDEVEEAYNDQFLHLPPVEMNSIYREPYQNQKAEQFHEDCVRDQALLESGQIDSCAAYTASSFKSKNYPNFRKLNENKGFQPVFLQNESVYQVLIVVFSNQPDAPVYASMIGSGDQISFKMNPGEIILFLPGNDWAPFTTSATSELPSENFKHHFCLQDENFKAMLYEPYRLKTVNQKKVKLLLNESARSDSDFFLLDLYEALEPLSK